MKYIITSESVGAGHPDKVCDRISDRILTEILKQDKNARVAVECLVTTNFLVISGEVTTTANIGWTIYDVHTDQTYRAILDIVQFITAIWGYIEWSKK